MERLVDTRCTYKHTPSGSKFPDRIQIKAYKIICILPCREKISYVLDIRVTLYRFGDTRDKFRFVF